MLQTDAPRTWFVLDGALRAFEAGALTALFSSGVISDGFAHCSPGALNAAFFAADPTPRRAMEPATWWSAEGSRGILGSPVDRGHARSTR